MRRGEILLQDELHRVGYGLEKPGGPDAIGPKPILDERAHAALRVNAVGDHRKNHEEDDREDFEQ